MSKPKLLKGITKARQKLMTAAQKARAKKTQDTAELSSRRDMKDAVKPKTKSSAENRRLKTLKKDFKKDAPTLIGIAGAGTALAGFQENRRQSRETSLRQLDQDIKNERRSAKRKGDKTFTVDGSTYDTSTGKKMRPPSTKSKYRYIPPSKDADNKKPVKKANGGLASAAKTIAGKTTRSRNKTRPRGVGVAMRGYGKALK